MHQTKLWLLPSTANCRIVQHNLCARLAHICKTANISQSFCISVNCSALYGIVTTFRPQDNAIRSKHALELVNILSVAQCISSVIDIRCKDVPRHYHHENGYRPSSDPRDLSTVLHRPFSIPHWYHFFFGNVVGTEFFLQDTRLRSLTVHLIRRGWRVL
jgi:hypothetical protein